MSRSPTQARKTQRNGKLRLRGVCAIIYFRTPLTVLACSAEVAMDRRDEMDVPGWKLGDACVVLHVHRLIALTVLCHRVPYAALANAFALIEATTKRIEKTSLLTSLMLLVIQRSKEGDTDSLLRTVYLCINRVRFSSDALVCSSG